MEAQIWSWYCCFCSKSYYDGSCFNLCLLEEMTNIALKKRDCWKKSCFSPLFHSVYSVHLSPACAEPVSLFPPCRQRVSHTFPRCAAPLVSSREVRKMKKLNKNRKTQLWKTQKLAGGPCRGNGIFKSILLAVIEETSVREGAPGPSRQRLLRRLNTPGTSEGGHRAGQGQDGCWSWALGAAHSDAQVEKATKLQCQSRHEGTEKSWLSLLGEELPSENRFCTTWSKLQLPAPAARSLMLTRC